MPALQLADPYLVISMMSLIKELSLFMQSILCGILLFHFVYLL